MKNIKNIVEQAKEYQYKIIDDFGKDPYNLKLHLPEAEKWANKLIQKYPKADKEVVLLSVWLHDTGHYTGKQNIDHAIKSEKIARDFLAGKIDKIIIEKVAKVIRSHRCKDVMPETLEEKIIACADSASHFTSIDYLVALKDGRFEYVFGKLERDFRDINLMPGYKKKLTPLYLAWKKLFKEYKETGIVKSKIVPYDRI